MTLQVWQIDAWANPIHKTWTYNNTIPICKVTVNGDPTKRKILKALRDAEILKPESIYRVDDCSYDGWWSVQLKSNYMPLFDLQELV